MNANSAATAPRRWPGSIVFPACLVATLAAAPIGPARVAGADAPRPAAAVARGRHLALEVCAVCHVVARDQPVPPQLDPPAPSFVTLAARPDLSVKSVRQFISRTHWNGQTLPVAMPDLRLTADQARDVAEYLLSLADR